MSLMIYISGERPIMAVALPTRSENGIWIPTLDGKKIFLYWGENRFFLDKAYSCIVEAIENKAKFVCLSQ